MRILFIRHGDPDYINDTLTKKGHREAKLLAERAADLNLGSCYVSPLGRAKDTAQYCLDKVAERISGKDRSESGGTSSKGLSYRGERKWSVCAENRVGYRSVVLDGTWRMYGQGCVEKIRSMPKFRCGGSI